MERLDKLMRPGNLTIKAQTAVEYLLLLGVVTAIMLVAFRVFLPRANASAKFYYNEAAQDILDEPPINASFDAYRTNYP